MKKTWYKIGIFSMMLLYNLSVILFSLSFKRITDLLTNRDYNFFYYEIIYIIGIVLTQVISYNFYVKLKNIYVQFVMTGMKGSLLTQLFSFSVADFHSKDTTEYLSFFLNELNLYEENSVIAKIDLIEQVSLFLLAAIGIIYVFPPFLIVVAVVVMVVIFLPVRLSHKAQVYNDNMSGCYARTTDKLSEMLNGFDVIKSFSYNRKAAEECAADIGKLETSKKVLRNYMVLIQSFLMFLTTFLTLIVFSLGGFMVIKKNLTVGSLFALIQLLFYITNPVLKLMTLLNKIKSVGTIKDKINQIISYQKERQNGFAKNLFPLKTGISIKNLCSRYADSEKDIVRNFSFEFKKGKKYLIVGENGSGKSTLLKTLARMLPQGDCKGSIKFDGGELYSIGDEDYWKYVSYMSQEGYLFNKSLEDNIYLDSDRSGEERIIGTALEKLELGNLLKSHGGDFVVSDKEGLSGGEKQKIIFLRELHKKPGIILADEPDSALDSNASAQILDIFLQLPATCIIITHRLSSIMERFDEILVMDQGELAEHGSYVDLLKRQGKFYHMVYSA